jgi:hypothetical protein
MSRLGLGATKYYFSHKNQKDKKYLSIGMALVIVISQMKTT